ncbi:MAG: hypothetical protein Q8P79_01780 [Nanoarchaeota archaeon]|nr:hypothetical protein [Nanoarchaeota archaeon]
MGLFGFGKKKEKTLEELAGEFGITLVNDSLDGVYEKILVKGADESEEIAKIRLLRNCREKGARLLSSRLLYSRHESFGKNLYVVASVAYLLKAS